MKHQNRYCLLFVLLSFLLFEPSFSDDLEVNRGAQVFRDLENDFVLLSLSAHPDDEDGATLAYYRKKFGVKVYSVFFTRGEGGQNEKGPELYEELGAIRTEETERAAAILGSEVSFLNFYDFGYSKTANETFQHWGGKGEVLRRLVEIIRALKPDVIITNHNTSGGHGHHQAVAILAIEAFDAAADTSYCLEQMAKRGVDPWQPRKLFFRAFRDGRSPKDRYEVTVPVGEFDAHDRESYSQKAQRALREHVTQGMDKVSGRINPAAFTYYRLERTSGLFEADSLDFFAGIDLSRSLSSDVLSLRAEVSRFFSVDAASVNYQLLDRVVSRTSAMLERDRLSPLERRLVSFWRSELNELAQYLAGVQCHVEAADWLVVPSQKVELTVSVRAGNRVSIDSMRLTMNLPNRWSWQPSGEVSREYLKSGEEVKFSGQILVPRDAQPTFPRVKHLYDSKDVKSIGTVVMNYSVEGGRFENGLPLRFEVAPLHVLDVEPRRAYIGENGLMFRYRVTNHGRSKTAGRVRARIPSGWYAEDSEFIIPHEDSTASGILRVRPTNATPWGQFALVFETDWSSDTVTVSSFPIEVPENLYVGVVEGFDKTLESTLIQLGVRYQKLREKDLLNGDLSLYHTVLIDMRAYLVRADLVRANERLLQYVKDGGNVVVFYQKEIEWRPEYAPYSIELSDRRVSDESAPVVVLSPSHPLFHFPNRIVERDWDGWVQERGLYFPARHALEYQQLLACADPDEPILTTGYLVADYGDGGYIYSSYSWHRQLRDAHPGALRNFVNMISYGLRGSDWRDD